MLLQRRAVDMRRCDPAFPRRTRYAFLSSTCGSAVYAESIRDLTSKTGFSPELHNSIVHGHSWWWLDVACPTVDDMQALSKHFAIHALTTEDIISHETKEKVELFSGYYFLSLRLAENTTNMRKSPWNAYILVFPRGTLSFTFREGLDTVKILENIEELRCSMDLNGDLLRCIIIDSVIDSFSSLSSEIEREVGVLTAGTIFNSSRDIHIMLMRIYRCRQRIIRAEYLMNGKTYVFIGLPSFASSAELDNWVSCIQSRVTSLTSEFTDHEEKMLRLLPFCSHCIPVDTLWGNSWVLKGLDEGLISTTVAQNSFIDEFDMNASYLNSSQRANRLSNITSMVHIGSIPGALIAFVLCEKIGLLWSMRQLCLLWLAGVVVVITSTGNLGQLYAGRFIMGMGIGQAGVVAPTYLAEIAPAHVRGMLVSIFAMSEYVGIMIGYFSAWGASLHIPSSSAMQWIIPQSIQIIVAGFLFLSSFMCEESPRHLGKNGEWEKAKHALGNLWGLSIENPELVSEIQGIQAQLHTDYGQSLGGSWIKPLKELLMVKENQRRLLFVISAQVLAQWSGANSLTTYAPQLFSLFGIQGQSAKLFVTAVFGAVKLIASLLCGVLLIDHIGRKRSLTSGILVQQVAILYIAIFLTVRSHWSGDESGSMSRAAIAAIISMYVVGIGWAMGWNSIQYIINAEIFPLPVRSTGSSLLMTFHYANRYGISKAVPSMLLENALQPKGTFWFLSVMTFFGLLWTLLLLPETAGQRLEETNAVFS
ncbi:unnamed protein product [Penicillium discolor]